MYVLLYVYTAAMHKLVCWNSNFRDALFCEKISPTLTAITMYAQCVACRIRNLVNPIQWHMTETLIYYANEK